MTLLKDSSQGKLWEKLLCNRRCEKKNTPGLSKLFLYKHMRLQTEKFIAQ